MDAGGLARLDVHLLRTESGWQVLGRRGGDDGQKVTHDFDRENDARRMLQSMLDTALPSCPAGADGGPDTLTVAISRSTE
jgi:hypothetical protein